MIDREKKDYFTEMSILFVLNQKNYLNNIEPLRRALNQAKEEELINMKNGEVVSSFKDLLTADIYAKKQSMREFKEIMSLEHDREVLQQRCKVVTDKLGEREFDLKDIL